MRTFAFFAAVAGAAVLASAVVPPVTIAAERGEPKTTIKMPAKKPVSKTKTPVRAAKTPAARTVLPQGQAPKAAQALIAARPPALNQDGCYPTTWYAPNKTPMPLPPLLSACPGAQSAGTQIQYHAGSYFCLDCGSAGILLPSKPGEPPDPTCRKMCNAGFQIGWMGSECCRIHNGEKKGHR
jgi:hypothetical protein